MILERVPALSDLADILATFQEQCEGRGETGGGRPDARSLGSRIIAVAHAWVNLNRGGDAVDVAPSLRIRAERHLDPDVVEVALRALR
jgi:HD-GYP domain-containing protein (c-di-GMP phosphodiesterase class II)